MARLDSQLTLIRHDIAAATGQADYARRSASRNDSQSLIEQTVIMERQIQRLQTDVHGLKSDP
jgi:hypothetical protein